MSEREMPELPEVETMRRGIACIAGSRVVEVTRAKCRFKPIQITPGQRTLRWLAVGRTIEEVGRVGKRVVVRLDSGHAMVFEPRMSGLLLVAEPPDRQHLRLQIGLSGGPVRQLLYWDRRGLGRVALFSAEQFEQEYRSGKLGPDALTVTGESLRARTGASRRAVKVALIDQRVTAGIGNLYASEILHVARLHPDEPCQVLVDAQWQDIAEATHAVLGEAIRFEGSTLSDGSYRNALNQNGRYQNQHRVYGRAGALCGSCGRAPVVRMVQAQRSTFYCPVCQKKGRKGRKRRPPQKH